MNNKTSASILDAYKIVIQQLQLTGCHPNLQRLDNECSAVLKEYMHDQDIAFQLVPLAPIVATLPNAQSAPSKITSLPPSAALTKNFHSTCGIDSSHKLSLL
jgi:hypothetical protein